MKDEKVVVRKNNESISSTKLENSLSGKCSKNKVDIEKLEPLKHGLKKQLKLIKSMLADDVLSYNVEFILPHNSRYGKYWYVKVFIVRSKRADFWDIYTNPVLRSTIPTHARLQYTTKIFGKELGIPVTSISTRVLKTEFKADTRIPGRISERLFSLIFPDNAEYILREIHGLKLSIKMKLVVEKSNFECPERIDGTVVSCVNRTGRTNFKFSELHGGWVLVDEAGDEFNEDEKGFSDSMVLLEMENASEVSVIGKPRHLGVSKKSKVVIYE